MNVPAELKYTKEHEWVRLEGSVAIVGITDWAQAELGDIVFIELPEPGTPLEQMGVFGTIEAVKAVSELYSPVKGEVTEINPMLEDDPMVVNRDPYGEGWMVKVKLESTEQVEELMTPETYSELVASL